VLPLLAQDIPDSRIALLIAISGVVGGAMTQVGAWVMKLRDKNKAEADKKAFRIEEHLKELLTRAETDLKESNKENHGLREQLTVKVNVIALRDAEVSYLKNVLRQRRITYAPFRSDDDEDDHRGDSETARKNTPPEGYPSGS
jgi:hypothetical protein